MSLKQKLSENFLGTETHKYYQRERDFYRQFILNKKELNFCVTNSKLEEIKSIFLGKVMPNTIDLGVILYSTITQDFGVLPYYLVGGESVRLLGNASSRLSRRRKDKLRKTVLSVELLKQHISITAQKIEKIMRKLEEIQNEGEEWKQGEK